MDRNDLQALADMRVADAIVLIHGGRWQAAYYLLGYAVECGLKACAAKQFRRDEVPDKTVVNDFYTHRMNRLLAISGVKDRLEERAHVEPEFSINWTTVASWSEVSRYDHSISEAQTKDMLIAVTDPNAGVLPWLKMHW